MGLLKLQVVLLTDDGEEDGNDGEEDGNDGEEDGNDEDENLTDSGNYREICLID